MGALLTRWSSIDTTGTSTSDLCCSRFVSTSTLRCGKDIYVVVSLYLLPSTSLFREASSQLEYAI